MNMRSYTIGIVIGRELADPGIEELDGLSAGVDLGAKMTSNHFG